MKNVVIIQARMGSTRLPGKVMKILSGRTVLAHVIERAKKFQDVQEIVIATTDLSQDEPIAAEARDQGVPVYRGSERMFYPGIMKRRCAAKADTVIRITSDCPLIDPEISSFVIGEYLTKGSYDYASNALERSYPRGLDTEVFSFASLERAHAEARESHEREHVTPYIYNHPDRFSCYSVTSRDGCPDYRWTLDTPEDWELIRRMYEALYRPERLFSWKEAIALMKENPEWLSINAHIQQKIK